MSEKANETAGTLTTCPMVSHLSTPGMAQEFAPVIDAAVAPLLDALEEAATRELRASDCYRFRALLKPWGRRG